jgi:hypothetical protein
MHFCADEMLMIMSMVPFVGAAFSKLHAWWHVKNGHHCHTDVSCKESHASHKDNI